VAVNKIKFKGIKKLKGGYGINFKPFKIDSYVYTGAKVTGSSKDYVKIEVTLVAKNSNGDERLSTFGVLENNTIKTLKRKNTFGTELFYKLSTIVQFSIKVAKKFKNKDTDDSDKDDSEPIALSGEVASNEEESVEVDDNTCMVSDCDQEAFHPTHDPMFCDKHESLNRVTK